MDDKEGSTKAQWEHFVEQKLVNFAELNGLEKLQVNNGMGCKAVLKRDKTGNWIASVTVEASIE